MALCNQIQPDKRNAFAALTALFLLFTITFISCENSSEIDISDLSEEEIHDPEFALAGVEMRDGLEVRLFASEGMVRNPTNMDVDDRGRVWVTEGVNYRPSLNPDIPQKEEGDRIVILEDTSGDGKADKETVFYQGNDINSALGIMVLGNRVIVSKSPDVMILTDTTGNDQADTKEILFTGIDGQEHDHGIHAFVFGPDGKLYFNMGDAGRQIKNADGTIIIDKSGNRVTEEDGVYRKGMAFRANMDGSELEVIGHNFRNPYEVAVDSYGNVWQSDNDDDGNQSVRINYIMEYGNYGYTDEVTGAGWRNRRVNMEEAVHEQHWHQNDPGVIPNLLNTGSGSPTGIIIYEGDLLPDVFHNQLIHTEPGHNVVRGYPVQQDGAGYSAEIENIMKGTDNQWIRQVDVAVAPDGSLFIADWYDPGVGGHQYRSPERGRIYRIAPGNSPYHIPEMDYHTVEGAIEALKSPNHETRSKAWLKLNEWGTEAEEALADLWNSDHSRYRARALWLLSKIDGRGEQYIEQALNDSDPNLRITGLRAARQLDINIIPVISQLVNDPSPQVRREAVIALRHNESPNAPQLWAELAFQYDGLDRWYLEALGIAADRQWDVFFSAWLDLADEDLNDSSSRDIIWRSRSELALPILADIITDPSTDIEETLRYFRAFHFHHDSDIKTNTLISLLNGNHPRQSRIAFYSLQQLDRSDAEQYPIVRQALNQALDIAEGTYEFLDLVERFRLEDRNDQLIELVMTFPDSSLGINSARHMLAYGGESHLMSMTGSDNEQVVGNTLTALGQVGNNQSLTLLRSVVLDDDKSLRVRQLAIEAFGHGSWNSEDRLLEMAQQGEIPVELESTAANVLLNAFRSSIREGAREYLQLDNAGDEFVLRPVSELVRETGNVESGRAAYERSCQICHQVKGRGINFGPELSAIADKLPREGLYNAILEPNSGIVLGYEGYILQLSDGSQVSGIIQSETSAELVVLMPGGFTNQFSIDEITSREQMEQSLMPAMQSGMTEQELIDLVEYLTTLKN
ncbi:MAG: PVC-type heme-binding CxxCH protein [Balneolaceae bacterium]